MAYTTAITGLTAQGNSAFSGLIYSNNDVSFTMTSSEYAQPNFKYIVLITDTNTSLDYKFYISQNAVNSGVFNAKTIFNQLVKNDIVYSGTDNVILQTSTPTLTNSNNVNTFTVKLYEGYDVGGVFTEDPTIAVYYDLMCVYGSGKQNFIVMGTNDSKPLALSQCYDDELGFDKETLAKKLHLPLLVQSETINWQKVSRSNTNGDIDSAYKILSWIADDGLYINSNYPFNAVNYYYFELYDDTNTIITSFAINNQIASGSLFVLPVGLKNLVNGGYVDNGTANSTLFWTVAGYDNTDAQVTTKYGFYIDDDCKYNPVHVYWLNQMGGWDSYSFIKKNERNIEVEKKRYKAYQGDFNTATADNPYATKNYTRELTEREPIVNTFINLTSDWLCESEFKFMRDLFTSKSVWIVDDNVDGYSIVPVIVQDTNYLMKRERNSKKFNQTLRLQIANNNETINTTASEFPIPKPEPCNYLTYFIKYGGNTGLNVGANYGDACNIIATNVTKDQKIVVTVQDDLGNFPIAGQTYYVQVDYTFNITQTIVRQGTISLGNVVTGGGTTTVIPFTSAGTSVIATGVWGTGNTTNNYFTLKMPGWSGGTSYSGNIYVTVGFGNCP